MKTYKLDGKNFSDIEGFYETFNQIFSPEYKIQNLDALNDILYGFSGSHLIRKNSKLSEKNLGVETTKNFWQKKLGNQVFNQENIKTQLQDLENGKGQTLFDIILEIFSQHLKVVLK